MRQEGPSGPERSQEVNQAQLIAAKFWGIVPASPQQLAPIIARWNSAVARYPEIKAEIDIRVATINGAILRARNRVNENPAQFQGQNPFHDSEIRVIFSANDVPIFKRISDPNGSESALKLAYEWCRRHVDQLPELEPLFGLKGVFEDLRFANNFVAQMRIATEHEIRAIVGLHGLHWVSDDFLGEVILSKLFRNELPRLLASKPPTRPDVLERLRAIGNLGDADSILNEFNQILFNLGRVDSPNLDFTSSFASQCRQLIVASESLLEYRHALPIALRIPLYRTLMRLALEYRNGEPEQSVNSWAPRFPWPSLDDNQLTDMDTASVQDLINDLLPPISLDDQFGAGLSLLELRELRIPLSEPSDGPWDDDDDPMSRASMN